MTDTEQPTLGEYRGKPILTSSVAIIKAGDGLSESMSIDPHIYEIGDYVNVLMRCKVADHRPRPIKKTPNCLDVLMRFEAETVTIVEEEYAKDRIELQRIALQEHRDRKEGKLGLLSPEELTAAHEAGQHAEATVPNCPQCDDEVAAVAAEERADAEAPVPIMGRKARQAKP